SCGSVHTYERRRAAGESHDAAFCANFCRSAAPARSGAVRVAFVVRLVEVELEAEREEVPSHVEQESAVRVELRPGEGEPIFEDEGDPIGQPRAKAEGDE